MDGIKLNKQQAKEFAMSIFADIEAYVNEHEKEYQEFLLEEQQKNERKRDYDNR